MSLLEDLKKRKIINNITNEKKAENFFKKKGALYIGFDPSFHSLHVGNLIMIILLKRFHNEGFKTYAILGGATGMIGDPSGKNSERQLLEKEQLKFNNEKITNQLKKYTSAKILNNFDFYKDYNVLDFLRNIGKNININSMLEKEIIKNRLESGISYTEFSYSILQGNDFYHLWKNENINLQIGGSDQWSNITTGLDLIKKNDLNNEAFGLTINLLTKKDGTKFGKSEKGAIYLDGDISSPYEMYQFFYNQNDEDIENLFNFFSFKKYNENQKIINDHLKNPKDRLGQKIIATEIVSFIHGEAIAKKIISINEIIFNKTFEKLNENDFKMISIENISINIKSKTINIIETIIQLKLAETKTKARQLVIQKSIKINNKIIEDVNFEILRDDAFFKKYSIVQKGKKDFKIINWV